MGTSSSSTSSRSKPSNSRTPKKIVTTLKAISSSSKISKNKKVLKPSMKVKNIKNTAPKMVPSLESKSKAEYAAFCQYRHHQSMQSMNTFNGEIKQNEFVEIEYNQQHFLH